MTTYSAQGTTADQAFVLVDPSMDKQELYVATSRSREETFLYATPEVQGHREEIAPTPDRSAEALPHLAQAAERDRAQLAAHEVALRSRFSGLPSEELVARSEELGIAASREEQAQRQRDQLGERIERVEGRIEGFDRQRERAQELKRPFRKDELARIDRDEGRTHQQLGELRAELRELPVPSGSARRELTVAERVLAERRELAITAARISPPPYIKAELGERPSDPTKRGAWDRGVGEIETYPQRHGVKDRSRAFGGEATRDTDRTRQEQARQQLLQTQRLLGLRQHREKTRALRRGLGLFR